MEADRARELLDEERARLLSVKADLDEEHLSDERESENLSELSGSDQHQADTGTETFEREKDLSLLERIEAELSDVSDALRRLEDGTYGRCEACHRPIGEERLEAMPAARFCIEDQAAAEREARLGSSDGV